MSRLLQWIKSQADHNVVSYSRFGLPGDETDDRPPPTQVHVAHFDENAKEYIICGVHSQRAALISSGIGISLTLFVFISVFFEFDWYNHQKGVDIAALAGLLFFLIFGIFIHYQVLAGIKYGSPRFLVPFIVIYTMLISFELMMCFFYLMHLLTLENIRARMPEQNGHAITGEILVFGLIFLLISIGVQSVMLVSVITCRNFLAKRQIHEMEVHVAEKCKLMYPGIRIVFGSGNDVQTTVGVANDSMTSPPPYNQSASTTSTLPTRTILETVDERS